MMSCGMNKILPILLLQLITVSANVEAAPLLKVKTVVSVYDGDTFTADLNCAQPVFCQKLGIRILGIDTPEMSDKRPDMQVLARRAKDRLSELLSAPNRVILKSVSRDKYFRLDATITSNGKDVATTLLNEGLARPYTGVGPKPW